MNQSVKLDDGVYTLVLIMGQCNFVLELPLLCFAGGWRFQI